MARRPALGGGGPAKLRLGGQGRRGGVTRGGMASLQISRPRVRAPTGYRGRPRGERQLTGCLQGGQKGPAPESMASLPCTHTPPGNCSRACVDR